MMFTRSKILPLALGAFIACTPFSAFAAGSKIIVINRDGTTTEFNLPDGEKMESPSDIIRRQSTGETQRVDPDTGVVYEQYDPRPKAEPAPAPVQKASATGSAGPVTAPAPSSKSYARRAAPDVATPGHKPDFDYEPHKWQLPAGSRVTKEAAKFIAIDVAPPSRNIEVYERVYQDRPVYQVTFKTEAGFHDVLVDAETGDILKR